MMSGEKAISPEKTTVTDTSAPAAVGTTNLLPLAAITKRDESFIRILLDGMYEC